MRPAPRQLQLHTPHFYTPASWSGATLALELELTAFVSPSMHLVFDIVMQLWMRYKMTKSIVIPNVDSVSSSM